MGLKKATGKDKNLPFKTGVLLLTIQDVTINDNRVIVCCDDMSFPITVKNEIAKSKDKTKTKFVNEYGKFHYAKTVEDLPEYFKTEQTRPSFVGESMLVDLIVNANDMAGDIDFLINAKRLCRQKDVSEIKSFLIDTQVVAWGTQYNGEQTVYYEFLPADTYPQFESDNPKTDKVKNWLVKVGG